MEYKNISSKFTLQSTGTKKDRMQRAMSKKVSYNKYIRFHISTMKGIVKDCFSLQYERLMKKHFTLHLRSYIPIPQYWPGVPCIYNILATFKLSCNTSHIKYPAFTYALIISRYDIIFDMHIHHIFTQNI